MKLDKNNLKGELNKKIEFYKPVTTSTESSNTSDVTSTVTLLHGIVLLKKEMSVRAIEIISELWGPLGDKIGISAFSRNLMYF